MTWLITCRSASQSKQKFFYLVLLFLWLYGRLLQQRSWHKCARRNQQDCEPIFSKPCGRRFHFTSHVSCRHQDRQLSTRLKHQVLLACCCHSLTFTCLLVVAASFWIFFFFHCLNDNICICTKYFFQPQAMTLVSVCRHHIHHKDMKKTWNKQYATFLIKWH